MTNLLASTHYKFVIIGGGIAGVTCLETLSQRNSDDQILLLSASPLVKVVTNYQAVTENLHSFDVEEKPLTSLHHQPNVTVVHDTVIALDASKHVFCEENEYVIGIRDTESIQDFQKKLSSARRVVVVGNGGIATELVHEITNCEIIWAIKDDSIVSTFVDAGAGQFLLQQISNTKPTSKEPSKRLKYAIKETKDRPPDQTSGTALGPDWLNDLSLHGLHTQHNTRVHVEYKVEVSKVWSRDDVHTAGKAVHDPFMGGGEVDNNIADWPVYIELSNERTYGCDFIVSATGVTPNSHDFKDQLTTCPDGGIQINDRMTTSVPCIYAAGDVSTASWDIAPHWLQMRLWTQARQQGAFSAQCMIADDVGETIHMDFCFELFAHVTKFFNYKVILLGRFNGQGLGNDYSLLLRITEGVEYIKVVLQNGRMQGAILIGETDLEETFENLILNQTDLSRYGEELLDPNIDIDDYFD